MEKSYLKLNAKKRMVKNNFRFFIIGILPFLTIILLIVLNYYSAIMLEKADFNFNEFLFAHKDYFRVSVITISIFFSFCLYRMVSFCSQNFFYLKSQNKKVTFINSVRNITFSQYTTFLETSIIRFFLYVSWFAMYFLPCFIMSLLLLYSYKYENYGYSVNLTLFVSSVILFLVALGFFFVTLKRYSMCTFVILRENEKNPLNVIAKSITLMENRCVSYAFYCLSFAGWILSCLLILPTVYVVPYVLLSKWCYVNSLKKKKHQSTENEKPIIFYIQKRVEN